MLGHRLLIRFATDLPDLRGQHSPGEECSGNLPYSQGSEIRGTRDRVLRPFFSEGKTKQQTDAIYITLCLAVGTIVF